MSHSVESHLRLDVKEYDRLIRTFVPGYESMLHVVQDTLRRLFPKTLHVIDLGTGTGALAYAIASKIPYATLEVWDVDAKMLEIARVRLQPFEARVKIVENSFFNPLSPCDAVLASLSLHHIPQRADKDKVFRNIFQSLNPGGIFLNADTTISTNENLKRLTYENWASFMQTKGISSADAYQHFSSWAKEDTYFSLFEELHSLHAAGFSNPECLWREGPSTVYGGVKNA